MFNSCLPKNQCVVATIKKEAPFSRCFQYIKRAKILCHSASLCLDFYLFTLWSSNNASASCQALSSARRIALIIVASFLDYLIGNDEVVDTSITKNEAIMIKAMRRADERARQDALVLLERHRVNK